MSEPAVSVPAESDVSSTSTATTPSKRSCRWGWNLWRRLGVEASRRKRQRAQSDRRVRTPVYLQMEASECGAAALGIILLHFGRYVPLEQLRIDCGVSRDGTKARLMVEAARKYGLEVKPRHYEASQVRRLAPPFVVFWQNNHFLVVEGFRRGRVYLNDPASGHRVVDDEEFDRSFSGPTFRFERGTLKPGGRRPSLAEELIRWSRGAGGLWSLVFALGLMGVVPSILSAVFGKIFVDAILIAGQWDWFRPLLIVMLFTMIARVVLLWLQQNRLLQLELGLTTRQTSRVLWRILHLPMSFFHQRFAGDVASRITANPRIARVVAGEFATLAISLLMVVFFGVVMISIDPQVALTGIALGSLNLLGVQLVARWRSEEKQKISQLQGKLTASLTFAVQTIETIKASASEADMMVRWTGFQTRLINARQRLGMADAALLALPATLGVATTAAVLGLGGAHVVEGTLSIGGLLAMQTLLASFLQPFNDLVRIGTTTQELEADLNRLNDVIHHDPDPTTLPPSHSVGSAARASPPLPPSWTDLTASPSPKAPPAGGESATVVATCAAAWHPVNIETPVVRPARRPPPRLSGLVQVREVTFGYQRYGPPLLEGFNLTIQPGGRIALVGGSGSGKSTIGKLIVGLLQPWSGEILFDQRPRAALPRATMINSLGIVDEFTFLFAGTIRENLTLWDETIPEEMIQRAAIDARIHGDLIKRPGGYASPIREAALNFSGGQRQRLEIARALTRDPSLLILDEATSALDPKTEEEVDDAIRQRGCACLIIAHRLSTIRDADEIVVLRQGKVVERGTHEELLDLRGEYWNLIQQDESTIGQDPQGQATQGQSLPRRRKTGRTHHAQVTSSRRAAIIHPSPEDALASGWTESARESPERDDSLTPLNLERELDRSDRTSRIVVSGRSPVPLDDPNRVWQVVEGKVDVFLLQSEANQAAKTRRHLCRILEGGTIFGVGATRGPAGASFLAVGVGEARLRSVHRGDLIRLGLEDDLRWQLAQWIDGWIEAMSRGLAGEPPRFRVEDLKDDLVLAEGDLARPRSGVVWVWPRQGSLRFLGEVTIPRNEDEARFPLAPGTWIQAETASILRCRSTERLLEDQDPWIGLKLFHEVVLRYAAQIGRGIAMRRNRIARASSLRDEAALGNALGRLIAPLQERNNHVPIDVGGGQPLLAAYRAVASVFGIEVKPPRSLREGQGVSDPLTELGHASGLHARRVRLRSDWWRSAAENGPLLAFLEPLRRPVALLPNRSGDGYDLFDPSHPGRIPYPPPSSARTHDQPAAVTHRDLATNGSTTTNQYAGFHGESQPRIQFHPRTWWRRKRPARRSAGRCREPSRESNAPISASAQSPGQPVALSPYAYRFYRGLPGHTLTWRDLLTFSWPVIRGQLRWILVLGVVVGLLLLIPPIALGLIIDQVVPAAELDRLALLCGAITVIALMIGAFRFFQGRAVLRIEGLLATHLLPAIWDRVLRLPTRFFAEQRAGDLAHRLLGFETVLGLLSGATVNTVLSFLSSSFALILLFWYQPILALVALGLVVAMTTITFFLIGRYVQIQRRIRALEGEVSSLLLELLAGIARIRVAAAERRAFARWSEVFVKQVEQTRRGRVIANRLALFYAAFPLATMAILYAATVPLVASGLEVGHFLAFNFAFFGFVGAALSLGNLLASMVSVIPIYDRIRPVLETPVEQEHPGAEVGCLGGAVSLSRVSYRYHDDGPLVLNQVDFQVLPGEFVALVGPSGSGKSTLFRLLLGFDRPTEGVVAYDGKDLATLDLYDVRRQLGVVLQNTQLMPGDLYTNIVGFSSSLTMEDAWEAARLAGIAEDIAAMPMQMHTVIGEGAATLSGGQRQRLFIARALVKKPALLLFDEATSALDNPTQRKVSDHIASLKVTRVVIAHRLSTIMGADRVYVLKEGRIVQKGRYEELIREPGVFREMALRQQLLREEG